MGKSRIDPKKRALPQVFSGIMALLLPGSAQLLNGQLAKGLVLLLAALGLMSAVDIRIYFIFALFASSDAYICAYRQKLGDWIGPWDFLFMNLNVPNEEEKLRMGRTLIKNARIYDGTGARPFTADLLIDGGIIRQIADVIDEPHCEVVDAGGKALSPGFINTHSHFELQIFENPDLPAVVGQGITTEVLGQDGSSVMPTSDECVDELMENMAPLCGRPQKPYWWRSYGDYMKAVEEVDPAARYVSLIGYGTVRMTVMSSENRKPTPDEMQRMLDLIEQCLLEGAKGVSYGMIYPPCSYADFDELVAVCALVAKHDGLIMVHTRNEMARLIESFEEFVDVMKETGVRLQISHLKSLGHENWGRVKIILDRMVELQAEGYDITFDQYPWTAGSTGMKVIAPAWAYAGGEDEFQKRLLDPATYEKILVDTKAELKARGQGKSVQIAAVPTDDLNWMCGLRLDAVAEKLGMEEAVAVLHLLQKSRSSIICVYHAMDEQDVQMVMKSPYHTVCTDGIVGAVPHPRTYSTYGRFLGRYVRDLRVMPLETAIQHITSEPARRLRLWDRGIIREGMSADLVLFDPDTIIDTNSYEQPKQTPRGILKVWVQGRLRFEGES